MISQKLVDLIEQNAEELAKRFMKDLLSREETRYYKKVPEDRTHESVFEVYRNLGSWLSRKRSIKEELQKHYMKLGRQRYRENIPLNEVVMAYLLAKRHIWLFVLDKQIIDSAYELQTALDLNNRVVLFFDRVIFFITKGYEEELKKDLEKAQKGASPNKPGLLSRLLGRKGVE
ncbi:MAG: hypothetical protein J7J85_07890 [Deltaproteobacteria bacterium]|nr:hypothetical protein [Deltaproteobacteria bacterium]